MVILGLENLSMYEDQDLSNACEYIKGKLFKACLIKSGSGVYSVLFLCFVSYKLTDSWCFLSWFRLNTVHIAHVMNLGVIKSL